MAWTSKSQNASKVAAEERRLKKDPVDEFTLNPENVSLSAGSSVHLEIRREAFTEESFHEQKKLTLGQAGLSINMDLSDNKMGAPPGLYVLQPHSYEVVRTIALGSVTHRTDLMKRHLHENQALMTAMKALEAESFANHLFSKQKASHMKTSEELDALVAVRIKKIRKQLEGNDEEDDDEDDDSEEEEDEDEAPLGFAMPTAAPKPKKRQKGGGKGGGRKKDNRVAFSTSRGRILSPRRKQKSLDDADTLTDLGVSVSGGGRGAKSVVSSARASNNPRASPEKDDVSSCCTGVAGASTEDLSRYHFDYGEVMRGEVARTEVNKVRCLVPRCQVHNQSFKYFCVSPP